MARPLKDGLDYFPLDTDIEQDDKVFLLEAKHGHVAFYVLIKMLCRIYHNGYYYNWSERESLIFSKKIDVDINLVNVIINDCLCDYDDDGIFNKGMYEKFSILTSHGIQSRYLKACERRKEVKFIKEYMLLDENEVNSYKNLVIVDINGVNVTPAQHDVYKSTQSKVKESKVKKESEKKFSDDSIEIILSKELYAAMLKNNPKVKEPNFQTWSKNVDLMLRCDNRSPEEIRRIILFSQNDNFWKGNILSTAKLREKFDQLMIQSKTKKPTSLESFEPAQRTVL